MKIQIRRGVFETNSSSTHSLTLCLKSEYEDWKSGRLFRYGDNFYTQDGVDNLKAKLEMSGKYFWEDEVYTYDAYWNESLESFEDEYTAPSGDVVIAFGQFGYDG